MSPVSDDPRTDSQLVEAINAGDVDAFETLYRRHRDWVVKLAYRFTADRELSLDVMQETFAYVLAKFPGFELTARFTTFLYPVVRHLAIGEQQKARRRNVTGDSPREAAAPADSTTAADVRDELAVVMGRLSEDHREVVLMRFVDGFSLDQISQALRVPLGTVKSRLHHAIRALRIDPKVRKYFEA